MKKIVIVGTGGLAREFTSYFTKELDICGYFSKDSEAFDEFNLPGKVFLDVNDIKNEGIVDLVIPIGDPNIRQRLYLELKAEGFKFPYFVHSSSTVSDNALLSEGVVIAPQCCIGSDVKLGLMTFINFCCGIGHDCDVASFVQINPGTQIGGGTTIGELSLIGSGVTIRENLSVGDRCLVGFGSVVHNRINDGARVLGNPAKRMALFS